MKLSCFVCHRSLANLVHSKVSVKGKSSGRVSCVLVNDRSLSTFFGDHVKMQRIGQRQAHPSHRWINKTLDATSRHPAKSPVHSLFFFLFFFLSLFCVKFYCPFLYMIVYKQHKSWSTAFLFVSFCFVRTLLDLDGGKKWLYCKWKQNFYQF